MTIPSTGKFLGILLALWLLAGCTSSYVVDAEFPRPLIEPLPVSADLVISEDFNNYVFVEDTEARGHLEVDIGAAQTRLFETVHVSLFAGSDDPEKYLQIVPSIEDFQYAVPRETRAEIYEIWLKYRIQVITASGEPVADWLVTGYGKTPSAFMKSRQAAIDLATTVALRDIGGQISIGFKRQPDIKAWLNRMGVET